MDRIDEYRNIIKSVLHRYSQFSNTEDSIKNIVIVSQEENHFLLFNEGWKNKIHIHNCLFHCEINNYEYVFILMVLKILLQKY